MSESQRFGGMVGSREPFEGPGLVDHCALPFANKRVPGPIGAPNANLQQISALSHFQSGLFDGGVEAFSASLIELYDNTVRIRDAVSGSDEDVSGHLVVVGAWPSFVASADGKFLLVARLTLALPLIDDPPRVSLLGGRAQRPRDSAIDAQGPLAHGPVQNVC